MRYFKRKFICAQCRRAGKAKVNYSGRKRLLRNTIIADGLDLLVLPKDWDNFRQITKGVVYIGFVCKKCKDKLNKAQKK